MTYACSLAENLSGSAFSNKGSVLQITSHCPASDPSIKAPPSLTGLLCDSDHWILVDRQIKLWLRNEFQTQWKYAEPRCGIRLNEAVGSVEDAHLLQSKLKASGYQAGLEKASVNFSREALEKQMPVDDCTVTSLQDKLTRKGIRYSICFSASGELETISFDCTAVTVRSDVAYPTDVHLCACGLHDSGQQVVDDSDSWFDALIERACLKAREKKAVQARRREKAKLQKQAAHQPSMQLPELAAAAVISKKSPSKRQTRKKGVAADQATAALTTNSLAYCNPPPATPAPLKHHLQGDHKSNLPDLQFVSAVREEPLVYSAADRAPIGSIVPPTPSILDYSLAGSLSTDMYELTSGNGPNTWCVSQCTLTAFARPMVAELVCSEEMARKVLYALNRYDSDYLISCDTSYTVAESDELTFDYTYSYDSLVPLSYGGSFKYHALQEQVDGTKTEPGPCEKTERLQTCLK